MNYKNSVPSLTLLAAGQIFCLCANANISSMENPTKTSLGSIGLESTSFLYKSSERGNSSTTIRAGIAGKAEQRYTKEQADLTAYSFITDDPSFNAESQQIFVATQKGVIGPGEVTVGRRIYEWSKVDSKWDMMSLWSPHYTWDPMHPQTIGMTGLFYHFETEDADNKFSVLAFGSPLAIPERGAPIVEKDGMITSPNPFWKPLPSSVSVMGVPTDVRYTLAIPPMQEILFRTNGAIKLKYEHSSGYWVSGNAGVLPVHATQLAAETGLAANTPGAPAKVNVRPQFPRRTIYTLETGWDSDKKDWGVWASGSYERPYDYKNDDRWLNPVITPATVVSAGTDVRLTSNFIFHGGVLYVHEQPYVRSGTAPAFSMDLPSRFPVKQGVQIGGDLRHSDYTKSNVRWIQDLVNRSHIISLDFAHQFKHTDISIGAGGDIIQAQTEKGWVGQYYGDDRLRGWLSYAF